MKKRILLAMLVLATLILYAGCGTSVDNRIITENIVLENSNGIYTAAQIVMPDIKDDSVPLVTIGHGFRGTMNSGGAAELAERLANAGIATIRMDYNHYTDEGKSERTNEYTLATMEEDQLLCIEYMTEHYSIDKSRIGLYARSMGGRVAMTMANKAAGGFVYKAMVLVAPAGNDIAMEYYMGGHESWNVMKELASENGFVEHQGLRLKPEWFSLFEEYNPAADKGSYKGNVLVICNTLDYVVTDETSRECASAYENSRIIEVTTEDGHGYEMGYKESELKDRLMNEIVVFFSNELE